MDRGAVGRGNPIQAWLDDVGIPWKASRGELASRYGVTKERDGLVQEVEIALARPALEGLVRPLRVQFFEQFTPRLPATEFYGETYFMPDEQANLRRTAAQLATVLGETPIDPHANTIRAMWTFGRAKVQLLVWPPEMQGRGYRAPDRDPRLVSGCHVRIKTGFLLPPTAEELHRLQTFVPVGALPIVTRRDGGPEWQPSENELEFVRDPQGHDGIRGAIGMSADGQSLIFQNTQLFVISVMSVVRIRVDRIEPARGPGGSRMKLECLTDYDGPRTKMVDVCSAKGPDDLNALGATVSAAIKKPLDLGEYYPDD
jgi:hypothetical protein